MADINSPTPFVITVLAVIAILFGTVTLFSGGSTLFVDGAARQAAGDYVGFVLWFNFLAGFAYILAGIGLFQWHSAAPRLPIVIAAATLFVFAAFGIHILLGGAFEQRTVGAMILRSVVWLVIATVVHLVWQRKSS
ncbi:MAG: hypothetical protein GY947_19900 [Rhodobacteraceae bacterium]|nr:hypothetical protein [Paracoccaceae bacterium]